MDAYAQATSLQHALQYLLPRAKAHQQIISMYLLKATNIAQFYAPTNMY